MDEVAGSSTIVIGNEEDYQRSLGIEAEVDVDGGTLDTGAYEELTGRVLDRYPNLDSAAVGCLKHIIEGDFLFLNVDEVHALASGKGTGRIQR